MALGLWVLADHNPQGPSHGWLSSTFGERTQDLFGNLSVGAGGPTSVGVMLLAEGRSYREIGSAALASPNLVRAVKRDYAQGGLKRALGREGKPVTVAHWLIVVVRWLLRGTPRDFGFFRARWSCGLLAMLLWEEQGVRLSPETIRRGLHRMEFVWRRPRPVVGPHDPQQGVKLRRIRRRLAGLPA